MSNTDRSVWELQEILRSLGAPIEVDKKYGPVTERTWQLLSSRLGLNPYIRSVSPHVASVDKTTHEKLLNEYILRKAPKPAGSNDFERLNNAIVVLERVAGSQPKVSEFVDAWTSVANSPTWRSIVGAIPPAWAFALSEQWKKYLELWGGFDTDTKTKLVHPAGVEPGGVFSLNAWRDLWDPALQQALQTGSNVLRDAGKQLAKGAAEETRKQTYEWAYSLGGVALGAFGVWWLLKKSRS